MFTHNQAVSMVTAVLPDSSIAPVSEKVLSQPGSSALVWQARGTLLQEHWWKKWLPPISPAKTMMHFLVPNAAAGPLVSDIVEAGRLHQQATGAVFSTPCEHAYFGSAFHAWPESTNTGVAKAGHKLTENLYIIYCIVGHSHSERVSKAAINAGAHGPVVYYSEGRGLRDRLGWLRITKEHEKEVLMVIADESDADAVFESMAKAGELHLPGRGFMYRMVIDRGMFNLPSRVSHHHYDANMQQIINAIDHLGGHTHWRDQSVFDVGGEGRGVGLDELAGKRPVLENQVCLSAIATRKDCPAVMDMLLDSGAPGLNVTYARFTANNASTGLAGTRLNDEYGMLRCITDAAVAAEICKLVERDAEARGLEDLGIFTNAVHSVATYLPGNKDYRTPSPLAAA